VALLVVGLTAGTALAAKNDNGNSGHGGNTTAGTSDALVLVPLYSHPGGPSIGDLVTFAIQTSQPYPYVRVSCYQGSTLVYTGSNGFYASYPWDQNFQLGPSMVWSSGSASCTADLFYASGTKIIVTATTAFTVSG
jgi:hypothetical protein